MNYLLFLRAFQERYKGIKDKQLLFQYLREELQYLILHVLYTKMTYPIYFMGGTKLRLSYGINRFSEDIDLALDKANPDFPGELFFAQITKEFSTSITGFHVNATMNTNRNVLKIILAFSQILHDIGFSPLPEQTIKIKIELDINPPADATYEKKNYRSLAGDYMISTHDLSTGFAGKIAAILFREYQKGRDYYDLQWYFQQKQKILINMAYLNANGAQQRKKAFKMEEELLAAVEDQIKKLDIPLLKIDLERFIVMDQASFNLWLENYIHETLLLLKNYKQSHESR